MIINKVAMVSFLSKPGLEGKTDVYFTNIPNPVTKGDAENVSGA